MKEEQLKIVAVQSATQFISTLDEEGRKEYTGDEMISLARKIYQFFKTV